MKPKYDAVLIYRKRIGNPYGFPLGYRGKDHDNPYHWRTVREARDYAKRRAAIGHWAGELEYEITGKVGLRTFYTVAIVKVPKPPCGAFGTPRKAKGVRA